MLPLTSPFDSFRAGIWVIRENLGLAIALGLGLVALDPIAALVPEPLDRPLLLAGLALVWFVITLVLYGTLLVCFHATFLFGPGDAQLALDRRRILRVSLRVLGLSLLVFLIFAPFMYLAVALAGIDSILTRTGLVLMSVGMLAGSVTATVILGIRFPHIVKHPDRSVLPPSVSVLACVRKVIGPLLCGPVLLFMASFILHHTLTDPIDPMMTPIEHAVFALQTAFEILAAAMTAAILSDAYLQFEAEG